MKSIFEDSSVSRIEPKNPKLSLFVKQVVSVKSLRGTSVERSLIVAKKKETFLSSVYFCEHKNVGTVPDSNPRFSAFQAWSPDLVIRVNR